MLALVVLNSCYTAPRPHDNPPRWPTRREDDWALLLAYHCPHRSSLYWLSRLLQPRLYLSISRIYADAQVGVTCRRALYIMGLGRR